ncbi:amidase [Streptomyces endophyticus]|uniref:Amidase n=1 Tax=Streptomyces endophyticus TaxID=714166 RepID=A0ABU6F5R8_9ACTN|nr:amidase [Streptomyces endophyticus]MEB8339355.1 amidase [Streptomyces endophyticus]
MNDTVRQPWSLSELVAELRSGRTTPEAALRRSRDRIARTEERVRAWVAFEDTPAAVRTGPLGGVPMGVKDIIDLAGLPTRCGSVLRADAGPAERDAPVVAAWRAAGAIPLGKTVTTEFAFFAPGPTRNPANLGHTPGGSSSGSAAAVAAGQVPLAIGSQTAGSVTRPAAYCGVASLVLRHGHLPTDGVAGLSPSLDAHGVYAATAADVSLAWAALTGEPDPARDAASSAPRIALWDAAPLAAVSDEMGAALASAEARLTDRGAKVDAFPLEALIAEVTAAHPVVMAYEAARERSAELERADRLSAPLAGLLRTGADTPEADYLAARRLVAAARAELGALLTQYDAVLGPAAPGAAPQGLDATGDPVLSRSWQALGLPTVAVPGLRNAAGLPLGLQVIAESEAAALRAAAWVERSLNG